MTGRAPLPRWARIVLPAAGVCFVAGVLTGGWFALLGVLVISVALLAVILELPDAARPPQFRGKVWRWQTRRPRQWTEDDLP